MISVILPISSSSTSRNYPDLVIQSVVYLLTKMSDSIDAGKVASIGRQISLLLVGVVIVISIRLVLRQVTRVSSETSDTDYRVLITIVLTRFFG